MAATRPALPCTLQSAGQLRVSRTHGVAQRTSQALEHVDVGCSFQMAQPGQFGAASVRSLAVAVVAQFGDRVH
eukprot:12471760-Alexandrium_andersonii.AAC.1